MLYFLLASGTVSAALAVVTIMRPSRQGTSAWFALAITSACAAIWVTAEILPSIDGAARALTAVTVASFSAGAALWLRAGVQALRLRDHNR